MKHVLNIFPISILILAFGVHPIHALDKKEEINDSKTYVVQEGDTLWDISNRFYQDPWYWPKMWSFNPHVLNPNWISPGTELVIMNSENGDFTELRPKNTITSNSLNSQGGVKQGLWNQNTSLAYSIRKQFLLAEDRIKKASRIDYSPDEKTMLSQGDRVYVNVQKNQFNIGQKLSIFKKVEHLDSQNGDIGQIIQVVGELEIIQVENKKQPMARIQQSYDVIERGFLVIDEEELLHFNQIIPKEAKEGLEGQVLGSTNSNATAFAQEHYIVVDLGKKDGTEAGDLFYITRGLDPVKNKSSNLTEEAIGVVMIVEVFKDMSIGIIQRSAREIYPGDHLVVWRDSLYSKH
jgi:LysM repeat protein